MSLFQWVEFIVSTVLSAGITFFIGFIIARFAGKIIKIILHEAELDAFFRKLNYTFSAEDSASKIIEFAIYAATIAIILNQFGILKGVVFLAVIFVVILFLVALILNVKEAVPNFIARLQINTIKVGDKININALQGKIEELHIFQTKIISKNNEVFWVPNVVIRKYLKK